MDDQCHRHRRDAEVQGLDGFLHIVSTCADCFTRRAQYVLDTLFMARGIPVVHSSEPPAEGPWVLYGEALDRTWPMGNCCRITHSPEIWQILLDDGGARSDALHAAIPAHSSSVEVSSQPQIDQDVVAYAFYFLASMSERGSAWNGQSRQLYANSVYGACGVPQDIVDRYAILLVRAVESIARRFGWGPWEQPSWPGGARFAVVLSHDVDFLPRNALDVVVQGGKTLLRHLIKDRSPRDAIRATTGLMAAIARGRDPYGCIPEIVAEEKRLGVRSSFQVAVGHRHKHDVNYDVRDANTAAYLKNITNEEFDLCLHGSFKSAERAAWYQEEVEVLSQYVGRPRGSRQHFLSFEYDELFGAQERTCIEFDMSVGYPDRTGPRAGFSHPYFPYRLDGDRPYDVLEIGLMLMDVTLRGYMRLGPGDAWKEIERTLVALSNVGGCGSVVWHPIVFGGARDPGYDELYWRLVRTVSELGGIATDGSRINDYWRARAASYRSFQHIRQPAHTL